jgi:hypothetical protein
MFYLLLISLLNHAIFRRREEDFSTRCLNRGRGGPAARPLGPFPFIHSFFGRGAMANKAHAAVVRRLNERYGSGVENSNGFDVHIGDLIIEVETTATLREAVEKLRLASGRRFIAVTNREALEDAVAMTGNTDIGVMDPWGDVVREAG